MKKAEKQKKVTCKHCKSKRTEIKKIHTLHLRDIGNPRKKITATYLFCKNCVTHCTIYSGERIKGALATPRLLDLIHKLVKSGKGNKDIEKAIGYRLPPTTIHDYYHIRDGQICDMQLRTKPLTKSMK